MSLSETTSDADLDALSGVLLGALVAAVVIKEWAAPSALADEAAVAADLFALSLIVLWTPRVGRARRWFVIAGAGLTAAALTTRADWAQILDAGLGSAAFIGAFFSATAALRSVSESSADIAAAGRYLAAQPPGRRYAALSAGGHVFGLLISYGAIALLGGLAQRNARSETDPAVQAIRTQRMLLAIQRGFVGTLAWSPIAFAMAISSTTVPGARWVDAVPAAIVSALILALTGWALDYLFKPRGRPAAPLTSEHDWRSLWPLAALLALLILGVGGFSVLSDARIVAIVLVVAPLIALGWAAVQAPAGGRLREALARGRTYLLREAPAYRGEIFLLMMAGFIGSVGARLAEPLLEASGVSLDGAPGWLILVGAVWLIPVFGQLGMNPILAVSLFAPLLPAPQALGLAPAEVLVALTAGWALAGASSPFTATTLLVGAIGGVSARHVGLVWNGLYTLCCAVLLSIWVCANAAL